MQQNDIRGIIGSVELKIIAFLDGYRFRFDKISSHDTNETLTRTARAMRSGAILFKPRKAKYETAQHNYSPRKISTWRIVAECS